MTRPSAVHPTILHVDMDAFYASVEVIKDPSLARQPVIVGGQGSRGVVTSASYEAREFGVRSAMPIVTARRLCPHGVFLRNDFESYRRFSQEIREVFSSFTPLVEPLSLDEAFLDVSGSGRLFGTPRDIAIKIKAAIRHLGLPCTVGVAPNKFLAKLASTTAKPDGLLVIRPEGADAFLHPLPVTSLWGVGAQTGETLRRLGLKTIGDLASLPRRTLERAVGEALGAQLHTLANGIDRRPVVPDEPVKSVGSEETFSYDLDESARCLKEVLRLSDRTATRLRSRGLCGRTVTLKVRFSNFKTITRSKTLEDDVDTTSEIYGVARDLLEGLNLERARIRLLGVTMSNLAPGPPRRQLDLLGTGQAARREELSQALDSLRHRFGERVVTHATLLTPDPHP